TRHDSDLAEMQRQILAVLQDSPESLTEAELGKHLEGRTRLKREALRGLVPEHVQRSGRGKRNAPFRYSLSLVPGSMREQETTNPRIVKFPDKHCSDSCSREPSDLGQDGPPREQGFSSVEQESAGVADEPCTVPAAEGQPSASDHPWGKDG